ncbi:DUF4349 domain-containing protein [Hymenobacter sp. 5317J-9]|uniref:DUF4349 domain-containing protein n=1 Tax=Hymenobacter sp. 5317J-9 TaxID=2932250 RepID=UPI001FD68912|nr:DUF4349 domain-containing protein [Hymenobacter sp. 5317J-9]UOQ99813.1 DUF4349 domain-containing protein [Hymenobacter sp. 5317J-9]
MGAAATNRIVVYEGKLNLGVASFDKASVSIDSLLAVYGAFQASAHETSTDGQRQQDLTLNVPPANFVRLVAALSKLGRVESKDVTSSDITGDVLEASNALNDQQAAQTKQQQLLAKATSPAQAQQLAAQGRELQAGIAEAEARLQRFGAQRKWATLALHYFQYLPAPEPAAPLPAFAPRFAEAFNRGWSWVLSGLVLLTNLWPLLLLGGSVAAGLRWWRQRQQAPA